MSETNISVEEQLAALQVENARLKAAAEKKSTLTMKVSEKGAASLYGLGRFPITLYKQQWERIFASQEEIKTFLVNNKSRLAVKE